MGTTSDVKVQESGSPTTAVAAYSITEDAETKKIQRTALNESDGSDTAIAAKLGALTETAPATDTASSGLNGRLQRIAQRISSLITLLPTALGAGGGLKVDGSGTALPVSGTITANAGTNLNTSSLAVESGGNLAGINTVLGAKTDAAATQTDATSISAMQVFKQISKTLQAFATAATGIFVRVTDGTNTAAVDATNGLKVLAHIDQTQIGTAQTTDFTKSVTGGFVPVGLPTDQSWKTGMSNKGFVAAFTTLTRPANTTAYAAGDSISDNATAASVSALSATVSDTNDDPIFIADILVTSTDTGLAGKRIRAYLFNSDPTANTGVGGGDNAAYSQKKTGYIGSFSGVLETGFSDGAVGRLVPSYNDGAAASTPNASAGGFVVVKPTSGARTLFIQYQAVDGFTPSANSTTIIGSARGWQARAA